MSIQSSLNIPSPHPPPPPGNYKLNLEVCESVSLLWVQLYHLFLDSIYKECHMIFLSLCLIYFTHYDIL